MAAFVDVDWMIEQLRLERDEARAAARDLLSRLILLSEIDIDPEAVAAVEGLWAKKYPWLGSPQSGATGGDPNGPDAKDA